MVQGKAQSVVISVSEEDYSYFLAPNMEKGAWHFDLVRHNPEDGIDSLFDLINESGARVLITGWSSQALPPDLLNRVPELEYMCHLSGEVGRYIPLGPLEEGLIVTNWGDSIARIVAEHCLLQALSALRCMAHYQISMHIRNNWREQSYVPDTLIDKTIGLHGFGCIAQQFVELVRPFNCQISAYSPNAPDEVLATHKVTRTTSLEELYGQNDVIICLVPLTPKTHGLVDEDLLSLIPEGGIFVNAGRGEVLKEDDVARVARLGRIGIALDVFAVEPLPMESPLRKCENVILTPHIGGPTPGTRYLAGLYALKNVVRFFRGEKLSGIINAKRYESMSNQKQLEEVEL
jgi:phosphoglycerate dehydrogenase-like enzyme